MNVRLLAPFAVLMLPACASDAAILLAPPEGPEPSGPAPRTGPAPAPVLPDPPDPPDSPWSNLQPGDLPEVFFAVAWSEYECCWQCDMLDPNPANEVISTCWAHYAVIDLDGQVVAEFPLPGDEETDYPLRGHVDMAQAGPGQFVAVTSSWGTGWDDDQLSPPWMEVWLLDAFQGTTTRVAHWDVEAQGVVIDATGLLIHTGDAGIAPQIGVWPGEPDRLAMWVWQGSCPTGTAGDLISVPMFDPSALPTSWKVEELLPEGLATQFAGIWPWTMSLSIDDAGSPTALFGVTGGWCGNGDNEWRAVATSMQDGPLWEGLLDQPWWPMDASYSGLRGGAALHVPGMAGGSPQWQLLGPEGTRTGTLPDGVLFGWPGPVIDPEGPTFALVGATEHGGYHHVIDFLHDGEPVWRIDALGFGLQERRIFLMDVELLWPVPEDAG